MARNWSRRSPLRAGRTEARWLRDGVATPTAAPTTLDRLDLLLLRFAKVYRPRLEDSVQFYEEFFTPYDVAKTLGDVRMAWRFGVVRSVYDRLFGSGTADVVDVGCGLGVSQLYLPSDCNFVGIDIGAATLNLARTIHGPNVDFRQGGFPQLPAATNSCDLALCIEVLEHIADDTQALKELNRIVRPGGYLLLSVPSTYYWPEYISLIGHYRHYSIESLRRLLASGGFDVVQQLPQFTAFWRRYYYLYIPLRIVEIAIQRIGPPEFCVYDSRVYRWLARAIMRWLASHAVTKDPQSTFVLCRKLRPEAS
jgi:ubiquinone/menaquinone biosynthesis C-methylase UbiE